MLTIPERDFFTSRKWFHLLADHCELDGFPLFIENSGCILPLMHSRGALRSLTNFYTMRYAPVFDDAAPVAHDVERAIRAMADNRWHAIILNCLPETEPITGFIADTLTAAGWSVRLDIESENWFQPTEGLTPDSYFASRPSRVRNTVERKWRKANREHRVDFRLFKAAEGLDTAIADYQEIYAKSWKEPERFKRFIPALIGYCAEAGALRLGILYVDGIPAATHLWIVSHGQATIYKLAYDDAFSELSVGSLLTKLMFDRVLADDRPEEVDYGTGSDSYKRDWMDCCRHLVTLTAYNLATIKGRAMAARRRLTETLRPLGRRSSEAPIVADIAVHR